MPNHPQPEQKKNAGGVNEKAPPLPPKDPKFTVRVVFVESGRKQISMEVHQFEIKTTCIVITKWDRFDQQGQPHMNWHVIPLDQIKELKVEEIDRPVIVVPSGIIHPVN